MIYQCKTCKRYFYRKFPIPSGKSYCYKKAKISDVVLVSKDWNFISNMINNYNTSSKWGFTTEELSTLKSRFSGIEESIFDDCLTGTTCILINNKTRIYHCDIITALKCSLEKRSMRAGELD